MSEDIMWQCFSKTYIKIFSVFNINSWILFKIQRIRIYENRYQEYVILTNTPWESYKQKSDECHPFYSNLKIINEILKLTTL